MQKFSLLRRLNLIGSNEKLYQKSFEVNYITFLFGIDIDLIEF
jgi:hypothetical protein